MPFVVVYTGDVLLMPWCEDRQYVGEFLVAALRAADRLVIETVDDVTYVSLAPPPKLEGCSSEPMQSRATIFLGASADCSDIPRGIAAAARELSTSTSVGQLGISMSRACCLEGMWAAAVAAKTAGSAGKIGLVDASVASLEALSTPPNFILVDSSVRPSAELKAIASRANIELRAHALASADMLVGAVTTEAIRSALEGHLTPSLQQGTWQTRWALALTVLNVCHSTIDYKGFAVCFEL